MHCRQSPGDSWITCTGGKNARVYLVVIGAVLGARSSSARPAGHPDVRSAKSAIRGKRGGAVLELPRIRQRRHAPRPPFPPGVVSTPIWRTR